MRETELDKFWESTIVGRKGWCIYESEEGLPVGVLIKFGEEQDRDQRGIAEGDLRSGRT